MVAPSGSCSRRSRSPAAASDSCRFVANPTEACYIAAIMLNFRRSLLFGAALAAATSAFAVSHATAAPVVSESEAISLGTIDGEQYTIDVGSPEVTVGQAASFKVTVKAKDGFKFNEAFPTKLKLDDPPAGLELPKRKLKRGDGKLGGGGKTFTFDVPVKATQAGSFDVKGQLKFSVCNDSKCVVQKKTLTSSISAK